MWVWRVWKVTLANWLDDVAGGGLVMVVVVVVLVISRAVVVPVPAEGDVEGDAVWNVICGFFRGICDP